MYIVSSYKPVPFHLYKGDDEPEKNKVGKHTDMNLLYALLTFIYITLYCASSNKKTKNSTGTKSSNGTVSKQFEDMNALFTTA